MKILNGFIKCCWDVMFWKVTIECWWMRWLVAICISSMLMQEENCRYTICSCVQEEDSAWCVQPFAERDVGAHCINDRMPVCVWAGTRMFHVHCFFSVLGFHESWFHFKSCAILSGLFAGRRTIQSPWYSKTSRKMWKLMMSNWRKTISHLRSWPTDSVRPFGMMMSSQCKKFSYLCSLRSDSVEYFLVTMSSQRKIVLYLRSLQKDMTSDVIDDGIQSAQDVVSSEIMLCT